MPADAEDAHRSGDSRIGWTSKAAADADDASQLGC